MSSQNPTGESEEYLIDRLSVKHYPLLKKLYTNAFHIDTPIKEIAARFDASNPGAPVIGFIAIHRPTNTAAAYYGVFPLKVIIDNNIVQAVQTDY